MRMYINFVSLKILRGGKGVFFVVRKLTITKAREKLTTLSGSLQGNDTIAVTSRGREVLALMRWDLYESISETLDILGDPVLMRQLKQSIEEAKAGKLLSLSKVKKDLGIYERDKIHKNRR